MNKYQFSLVLLLLMIAPVLATAENKKEESYNYKRGVELLLEEGDLDRGLEYLHKEVADHKTNGYAFLWIGRTYYQQKKYGLALEGISKAIKYLEKDSEKLANAYYHRALTYQELGEDEKMLQDLASSIKYNPSELDPYKTRGDYYFNIEDFEKAKEDYTQIITLSPGDIFGHISLGQTDYMQEQFEKAIEKYNYALKLDPDYLYAYSFRADAEFSLKKYKEALEDVFKVLQKDHYESFAGDVFKRLADTVPTMVQMKLKAMMKTEPSENFWPILSGAMCAKSKHKKEAIMWYEKAFDIEPMPHIGSWLSDCYQAVGNYPKALSWLNWELAQDSTDYYLMANRVILEDDMGMKKEAFLHVNELIDMYPEYYFGYYRRGWMKDKNHVSIEEAIADYSIAIDLNPEYQYTYLSRGQCYWQLGQNDLAESDYRKCLELDSIGHDPICTMYASFYLGDTIRALVLKDSILAIDPEENSYDVACLYSLMDSTALAMIYLRQSFEGGKSNFAHARRDQDLTNLRKLPEFDALLLEFEQLRAEEASAMEEVPDALSLTKQTNVPFTKEGGVLSVKCKINSLPLHFVFDTGASDISISSVEATFMLKNGYLTQEDISGKAYYMNANGEISEGTIIRLHEVNFGGLILKDVKASVCKNQKAPLLLGQSALQKLGKIEIDYEQKIIRVTRIAKN